MDYRIVKTVFANLREEFHVEYFIPDQSGLTYTPDDVVFFPPGNWVPDDKAYDTEVKADNAAKAKNTVKKDTTVLSTSVVFTGTLP